MIGFWRDGFYIPDGRTEYEANTGVIDGVLPAHGGILQADGTWFQYAAQLDTDFSRDLPGRAAAAGQEYIPLMYLWGPDVSEAVLSDPDKTERATQGILTLATTRFDAPWDGVGIDFENIPWDWRDAHNDWLCDIVARIHAVGLKAFLTIGSRWVDGEGWPRYTLDWSRLAATGAEYIDIRCYDYHSLGHPPDSSLAPEWYIEAVIQYGLEKGISRDQMCIGLGNQTQYWPVTGANTWSQIPHADAVTLVADEPTFLAWVESDYEGIVREKYATIGAGHLWLHDVDTIRHSLALVAEYGIENITLFVPGMGDTAHWGEIARWKAGLGVWHGYISVENLALSAEKFADLLDIVGSQGRLTHWNPSNITHSRVMSGTETIMEAVFRYGEMREEQCIQWLAAVLIVDSDDVSSAERTVGKNTVWTLSYDGTDYVDLTLFGGFGASWETSGAACRAHIG